MAHELATGIHQEERHDAESLRKVPAQGSSQLDSAGSRHVCKCPKSRTCERLEIEEEIFEACIDQGVLTCRGSWFRAEHDKPPTSLFFRTTFASASEEQMDVAIERFGTAVKQSFKL